jgi:hypothetical protein
VVKGSDRTIRIISHSAQILDPRLRARGVDAFVAAGPQFIRATESVVSGSLAAAGTQRMPRKEPLKGTQIIIADHMGSCNEWLCVGRPAKVAGALNGAP